MTSHRVRLMCAVLFTAALGPTAFADEPKFEYGKAPTASEVKWAGKGQLGFLLSAGNSKALSLTAGLSISREDPHNRVAIDGDLALVRSSLLVVNDANGDGLVEPGELERTTQTTSQAWGARARYDRFFAEDNSGYAFAHANSDPPAGKQLLAGGQIGYARRLVKTDHHLLAVEIGYDFSSESYVAIPTNTFIHSGRALLSYTLTLTKASGITAAAEVLTNLNREHAPNPNGGDVVDPLHDTRVNVSVGITAKLFGNVSLAVTGTLRYDQNPAILGKVGGIDFAPGYLPFAEPVDALVNASLVVAFL